MRMSLSRKNINTFFPGEKVSDRFKRSRGSKIRCVQCHLVRRIGKDEMNKGCGRTGGLCAGQRADKGGRCHRNN